MKGPKQPKTEFHPEPRKVPRSEPLIAGLPLAWRFSSGDRDGPWSIGKLFGDSRLKDVLLRLLEFESKTWNDIERTGSHLVEKTRLATAARRRLAEIEQDDLDELMSFRITGKVRVWCIRHANIMRLLWWDPDHQVCPVLKKHT
jgi:hypothetical protein